MILIRRLMSHPIWIILRVKTTIIWTISRSGLSKNAITRMILSTGFEKKIWRIWIIRNGVGSDIYIVLTFSPSSCSCTIARKWIASLRSRNWRNCPFTFSAILSLSASGHVTAYTSVLRSCISMPRLHATKAAIPQPSAIFAHKFT